MAACSAIRDDAEHAAAMSAHGIAPIDLAGGQSLSVRGDGREGRRLRRLRREHRHRRPGDDPRRRQEPRRRRGRRRARGLRRACSPSSTPHGGATTLALRKKLAAKAYARTAAYDAAISNWFADDARRCGAGAAAPSAASSPRRCATARTRTRARRSIVAGEQRSGVATARQVQGKQLSYNNINDTDAAYRAASPSSIRSAPPLSPSSSTPTRAAWPSGATLRRGLSQGAAPAIRPRPSAASSRSTARSTPRPRAAIAEIFTEVIIAPDATDEAHRDRRARRRTCACCSPAACPIRARAGSTVKSVAGGLLVQSRDNAVVDEMRAEGRHQARADRRPSSPTCGSPSASPST